MMKTVYVVMKHPMHPYAAGQYMRAGDLFGVYVEKKEADRIAAEKNANKPLGLYAVHTKRVTV